MKLTFDQGTLLLSDVPDRLVSALPAQLVWDGRVDAYRSQAVHYPVLRRSLSSLDPGFEDGISVVRAAWSRGPAERWRIFELRPYQSAALESWSGAGARGVVVLPTGAGKTRLALAALFPPSGERLRTLCLVPTRALLEQWCGEIRKIYSGPIGIQGDGTHTIETVTVATYESAYRNIARFGDRFDQLVVDECHHFGVGMRDEILAMCVAERRLGLTATLPVDVGALGRIQSLIGPPVFELSIGDLQGSYLADLDVYVLQLDLNLPERMAYEREMAAYRLVYAPFRKACSGASYLDWIRFASRTEEGRGALQGFLAAKKILAMCEAKSKTLSLLLERHWAEKTLIFTADTEVAYRISRDHLIMPITADIGRKERERMLARLREGSIRALVSCRVLNEGVDVPDAEVAVILGGAHGAREHVQRVGRVLRPSPGKRAVVYELVCRGTIETRQSMKRSLPLASEKTAFARLSP
jgi:superfamily II DNA or RNA helicase